VSFSIRFMGHLFAGDLLPQDLAVVAIEAKQRELLRFGRFCAAAATASATATARSAAPELRAGQGLVQPILKFGCVELPALFGVPSGKPIIKSPAEFIQGKVAILVR